MSLSRLHLVFVSLYSMSSLQYRRYTLIRLLPLCLSRLHPSIRSDIYVNVFFTISSMHSSIPLVSLVFYVRFLSHSVGNFQLLFPSPSPMYPRTPPSIFNTSRFPPGALSFYSPFSMSPLMSLRPLRRRMRDRCRQFLLFQVRLFAFSPFRPSSLCNCSITYVESVLSMQFYSVLSQALGLVESVPAFIFSPPVCQHLDVHLSLISGWVHLTWTHAGFRRCASIYIGSVLIVSLRPLSPPGFLR